MQGEALGPSAVVVGAGINVRLSPALNTRIDQGAADVETILGTDGGHAADRNRLLALLLNEFNCVLLEFERAGFRPFREDWQRHHVHQDRPVRLSLPGGSSESGLARGVGSDGALLLETARGVRPFHSGDVSLRAAGGA
jgi:BirA family biotin operon repressor/biotin-[acetyl-CoA-carboxylase] ligase